MVGKHEQQRQTGSIRVMDMEENDKDKIDRHEKKLPSARRSTRRRAANGDYWNKKNKVNRIYNPTQRLYNQHFWN